MGAQRPCHGCEKSPLFDAAKVALEKVVFFPTDDYDAAMRRLRAGELDIQERLPVQEIDYIRRPTCRR